jgi:hypothetical protein
MSAAVPTNPNLPTEIAELKSQVERLQHLLESERSLTIPEFCEAEGFSRAFYYGTLKKHDRAPREMRHSDGCIRISPEARRDWRRAREAESARLTEAT